VNWELAETNKELLRFFKQLIALRKNHPIFRRAEFFPRSGSEPDLHEIHWQSLRAGEPDWSPDCQTLGFMLDCLDVSGCRDDDFFVMLNSSRYSASVEIPEPSPGRCWHILSDTSFQAPEDIFDEDEAPLFSGQQYELAGMAALVLISKPVND